MDRAFRTCFGAPPITALERLEGGYDILRISAPRPELRPSPARQRDSRRLSKSPNGAARAQPRAVESHRSRSASIAARRRDRSALACAQAAPITGCRLLDPLRFRQNELEEGKVSTRCVTPSWHRTGSKTFGAIRQPLRRRRLIRTEARRLI